MIMKSDSYKRFIPAVLWAILLFFLSSLPSESVPTLKIKHEDLVLHFLVYVIFGYFLGIATRPSLRTNALKGFIIAVLVGIAYGATDEFHQTFVPGRLATVSDFIADSLGAVAGLSVYTIRLRKKTLPTPAQG